jgi:hypothetical protein
MILMATETMTVDIQEYVDEYVQLHRQCKEIEAQLKSLRKKIEPFMEENGIDSIMNTDKTGAIALEPANMAIVSAQYTTYSKELLAVLGQEVIDMVVETVVDRDKLDALVTLGAVESDMIKPYKQYKEIRKFTVKK